MLLSSVLLCYGFLAEIAEDVKIPYLKSNENNGREFLISVLNLLGTTRRYSDWLYWLVRSPFELNDLFSFVLL